MKALVFMHRELAGPLHIKSICCQHFWGDSSSIIYLTFIKL